IEAFDRAIAADPGFALPHAAKAHTLLERGDAAAARRSIADADSLVAGRATRGGGQVALFGLLLAGRAAAPRAPVPLPPPCTAARATPCCSAPPPSPTA